MKKYLVYIFLIIVLFLCVVLPFIGSAQDVRVRGSASVMNWVDKSTFTATIFYVVFLTAPAAGVLNVLFDWIAIKK